MRSINATFPKWLIRVFVLTTVTALTIFPLSETASASVAETQLIWSGVTLDSHGGFAQSFTPLAVNPRTRWMIRFGNACTGSAQDTQVTNGSCFTLEVDSSGVIIFGDLRSTSTETKSFSPSTCESHTQAIFGDVNGKVAVCRLSHSVAIGRKLTFSVKPMASDAGSWWMATVDTVNPEISVPIGAIRHDALPDITYFRNSILSLDENATPVNYSDCTHVPLGTAIFSQPVNENSGTTIKFVSAGGGCAGYYYPTTNVGDSGNSITLHYGYNKPPAPDSTATTSPAKKKTTAAKQTLKKQIKLIAPVEMDPKKITKKFDGNSLSLTVPISSSATKAFLISPILGYSAANPLAAAVNNHVANFVTKISKTATGKSTILLLYSSNAAGKSPMVNYVIQFPSAPAPSAKASVSPRTSNPTKSLTINCEKGDQKRLFNGSACPPGWKKS